MRLKSALRRGVAAAVIAGIVVSSGIPAYAKTWNIADGDITVKGASDESGNYNNVKQGEKDFEKDEGETVITGESDKNTVTIDTSEGNVDVTFDDLKIDVSGKKEGDGSGKTEVDGSGKTEGDVSGDSPVDAGKAAVTVQGDHDAAIELDGANELKSGSCNAGLEKNGHESSGKLTIKLAMLAIPLVLIVAGYVIYLRKYKISKEFYDNMLADLKFRETKPAADR